MPKIAGETTIVNIKFAANPRTAEYPLWKNKLRALAIVFFFK